ncbi:pyrroline-5-carboxylate reductase [Neisseria chenwenguii]|uniref:Pyrroline-5-carboxylate reductase n=1 Tax=Neisseria chenwenguii TaxID=1853278 RepID=A0A220S292_9NEIS|nr:pyrroline-5-carboxylate reductase [Neisseria chenwenguii]ASK27315.1 pyrroline-5-carboxylate reductase [Neisseria chenwenguii]ROV57009.1 pyrroline-5-carboxylate reductase [Neisseria chenwenguii]
MKICFLGGGNMTAAIAGGLARQGGWQLHIADRSAEKRERLARELGAATAETLPALTAADVLVLAVKPQDMAAACAAIETNGALVLSVAAGLSVAALSRMLGGTRRIVRVMPNTPAQIGLGISGMFAEPKTSVADHDLADRIMRAAGQTVWLADEAQMHALTGISGSGPAYVFYLMNALFEAAQAQGFDPETAKRLVSATFQGAAELAVQTDADFAQLQKNVTSKGGTTHEAVETFKAHKVADAIAAGVEACVARSQEMARQADAV